ncbi:MAG: hypothetical protein ABW168_01660 [Sedimenticola sp.]
MCSANAIDSFCLYQAASWLGGEGGGEGGGVAMRSGEDVDDLEGVVPSKR